MNKYNLLFLKEKMLLSIKKYNSWQQIQEEYGNYITSLNFGKFEEVIDYLALEYKLTEMEAENLISDINTGNKEIIDLTIYKIQ